MAKISEEEYLEKCKEFLTAFGKDWAKDTIYLNSGDNSCIMNPKSQFYEFFGGFSIASVAEYTAKKLGKKIEWENENYG